MWIDRLAHKKTWRRNLCSLYWATSQRFQEVWVFGQALYNLGKWQDIRDTGAGEMDGAGSGSILFATGSAAITQEAIFLSS